MANESSVLVRLRLLGASAFSRDAKAAGRGLGAIDSGASRASRRLGGVNKALGVVGGAMRTVGTAGGVALAGGLAYGVKQSVNFEQAMANTQARLLTTKGNMELLSQQALDLGAKTSFSAGQAADAMGEFAAAGFDTHEIMKVMPGTLNLAAASGTDLAFAAETTGAMIRQFGLHAGDAGHVADLLTVAVNKSAISMDDMALTMKYVGPVAGRFNQSIEDMSASAAILGNVGIKGETAGTTLRRALVNLVKPSGKTIGMLEGMGVSQSEFSKATVDAQGKLRPMPQMLGNLSKQFKGLAAPDRRKAIAQLFGVEALPGMLTLMDMGESKINKMSRSLTNSQGAAKKTAGIMRGTVKGAWDNFTGSVETASIRLLRGFNPALRGALNQAAGGVNKLTTLASAFGEGLTGKKQTQTVHDEGGKVRTVAVPPEAMSPAAKAGAKVREVLGGVVAWAQANLPKLGSVFMNAGRQLADAFKPAMPFITNVVMPVLKGIAVGVIGSVVAAFKVLVPMIKVVATVLGFVGKIAAPIKPIFYGIGLVIGFIAGGPILKLLGGLKYLGVAFRILLLPVRLAAAGFRFYIGVVGRVIGVVLRAHSWVGRLAGTFTGAGRKIVLSVSNFVGGVISKIEGLVGKIRGLGGRFLAAGKGLIGKLFGGIKSAFRGAAGAMAGLGRMLADWLNAHTPLGDKVSAGPVHFRLPALATGGMVKRGGMALVGERGPELAELPRGTTVYDAEQTRMAQQPMRAQARARTALLPQPPILLTANLHLSGKQLHTEIFRIERAAVEAT